MESTLSPADRLERIEFGCAVPVGFSYDDAGLMIKSLLQVGYHGRRVPCGPSGNRFRVSLPASLNGVAVELLLDTVYEVRAVVQSSRFLPIKPAHMVNLRRREGALRGQYWIEGC